MQVNPKEAEKFRKQKNSGLIKKVKVYYVYIPKKK